MSIASEVIHQMASPAKRKTSLSSRSSSVLANGQSVRSVRQSGPKFSPETLSSKCLNGNGHHRPDLDHGSRPLEIVILGLSITSSWGNGHATTYRGLVRELNA